MLAALVLTAVLTTACPVESAQPCVIREQAIVTKYVGTPYDLAWPCVPDCWTTATRFEVEINEVKLVDPVTPVTVIRGNVQYPTLKFTFVLPKAGLYYARVRACDAAGCSVWKESWNPTDTDSTKYPRGFLLQTVLAPVTGGGVH